MALIEKIKSRPFLSIAVFIDSIFILLQTYRKIWFNESDIPYLLVFLLYITLLGVILELIYDNIKKIKKSRGGTVKKLIHDKVFWISIGITVLFGLFTYIFLNIAHNNTNFYQIAQTTPYRISQGFWFFSIVGYSLTIGRMIRFLGFRYNTSYLNLILLYSFIILFWSLIIYSILKTFLKLFKPVKEVIEK